MGKRRAKWQCSLCDGEYRLSGDFIDHFAANHIGLVGDERCVCGVAIMCYPSRKDALEAHLEWINVHLELTTNSEFAGALLQHCHDTLMGRSWCG